MFKETYHQGVDRGTQEGLLTLGDRGSRAFDHHTDLCANCRFLPPLAQKILQVLAQGGPLNVMELGAGAGVGLSAISHLSPHATLHAAGSFTPVHPYLRFQPEWCIQEGQRTQTVRIKLLGIDSNEPLNIEKVMKIQAEGGPKIFEEVEPPYVHHQWVGPLANARGIPMASYDFVYETHGPNYHDLDPQVWARTKGMVKPNGVLLITSPHGISKDYAIQRTHYVLPQRAGTLMIPRSSGLGEKIYEQRGRWCFEEPTIEDNIESFLENLLQGADVA